MKELTKEQKIEYDKFMNEQFRILQGHASRITLKCHNKYTEILNREDKK